MAKEYNVISTVIEAAPRPGGRIRTLVGEGFETPAEGGAEFIHGDLPVTMALLKKAGIPYEPVKGEFVGIRKGRWRGREEHDPRWKEFMKALGQLKEDRTMKQFLDENFSGIEYDELRGSVKRFAEGFDLANLEDASMISVKKEWKKIDEEQYRVVGGYIGLIEYLYVECRAKGVKFSFGDPVTRIHHEKGKLSVHTHSGKKFNGSRAVITASLGALRQGDLVLDPLPQPHSDAIRQLGFGSVIKILLQFDEPFWTRRSKEIAFLLTDENIPSWWTQHPRGNALLTGWIGGLSAEFLSRLTDDDVCREAIQCLQRLFNRQDLGEKLKHFRVFNWSNEPFIRGGYSYGTIYSEPAVKLLNTPYDDTLYFAGEAYSQTESRGTVEAALSNGREVARKLVEGQRI